LNDPGADDSISKTVHDQAGLEDRRYNFFSRDGEMAARMRALDWRRTPLGDVSDWPQSLRTAVDILLSSRYPMFLAWGPKLAFLYNDGYRPIFGDKHPAALGKPFAEIWAEIWDDVGPLVERALAGEATWSEDLQLFMERRGFPEEVYFTFSYSPLRDDLGAIAGMFCACTETTGKVLGERRLKTLRNIAAATGDARSVGDVCRLSAKVMAADRADIPFSLLYIVEPDGSSARLAADTGCLPGQTFSPELIALHDGVEHGWPMEALLGRGRVVLHDLDSRLGLPGTPWPEPSTTAAILPLARSGQDTLRGYLIVGASRRLPFDEHYERFFDLLAAGIASALANVEAYEAERKRAEALAEIDRAKTAFFSNVSHEFRTPLTLMLGPLKDVISAPQGVAPAAREQLVLAHRNAMRLLKLVNSLLDFSRIEAKRFQASYEPTDLAELTADLASTFRSACEKAALELRVSCAPLPAPVYVDRDMWEKIVLNLLSNAFKYTLEGSIEVTIRATQEHAVLRVRDTGVGIPAEDLPHVFERFRRVEGSRGRALEGSGIGLALVQELVKLHGGTVQVESELGRGTTFSVAVPLGSAHLPSERIGADRPIAPTVGAAAYVEETLRWLPRSLEQADAGSAAAVGAKSEAVVLLADDNADMREYLARLLGQYWSVVTATNGAEALEVARRRRPDLILSDVMMPKLDGFDLLRALRAEEATQDVPFIMLSARAGEESRIEGIEAGADDYLVKPFSARELIARVSAHLALAQSAQERGELLGREQAARAEAEAANRAKDEFIAMLSHELRNPLAPILTAIELLKLRAGGQFERERALIERQARQLMMLVDDLLDVSRIARGKIEIRNVRIEMSDVVRSALETVEPLFEQRGHHVEVEVPARGLTVVGDPQRLAQVVSNLLTNAAKYTEPRGRIEIAASAEGDEIRLIVKDDGTGIGADLLPKVFDMFAQARQSIDRSLGGLGLGLTIARSIVELHGGRISAGSDGPGRGSTFTVCLPAAPDSDAVIAESENARLDRPLAGRRRVLVVDDNTDAAAILAEYLEASGHAVRVAHDGPAALCAAEEFHPEVALLDIGLPGMDGYELGGKLLGRLGASAVSLIAVTGYAQASERERTRRAGFAAHLVKPVDFGRLAALLETITAAGMESSAAAEPREQLKSGT
jgi:signal transduction histidine kinase